MQQHFRHLLLTSLLAMTSAAGAWADSVEAVMPEGEGTAGSPYLIASPANLLWMAQHDREDGVRQGHYRLTADLDMSSVCGEGVGDWKAMFPQGYCSFEGVFDGDGHTISNLYSHEEKAYLGLFRYLGECTIKDLTLANVDFSGTYTTGGLAAYCSPGDDGGANVSGVRVTGSITSTGTRVAAIVGEYAHGSFTDCVNEATITSTYNEGAFLGGIIGQSQYGTLTLTRCVNRGTINGSHGYVAGIVSSVGQSATITDCLNLADINASTTRGYNVAGIAGNVSVTGGTVNIDHCLNLASVAGYNYCSYILGSVDRGSAVLTDCYWNSDATLTRDSDNNQHDYCGFVGGNLTVSDCMGLTADEIAAGAAAFLLQDDRAETVWGQDLAASETYPVPSASNRVYLSEGHVDCLGHLHGDGSYTNTPGTGTLLGHTWESGYCTTCHAIESAPSLVDGYYEIGNAGQLLWFARRTKDYNQGNINGRLTADIDLSVITHPADPERGIEAVNWEMIGTTTGYTGTFDGRGHTISNYYIKDEGRAGLFRVAYNRVCNLKLAGGRIEKSADSDTPYYIGLLVGEANYATISDVEVLSGSIAVSNSSQYTGGIAGSAGQRATFEDCIVRDDVKIQSGTFVGGIVGRGNSVNYQRCANYATIQGSDAVAGIAGQGVDAAVFTDCYNAGIINATNSYSRGAAGIVAEAVASTRVINCFNTGHIVCNRSASASLISNATGTPSITNSYASADATITEAGSVVDEPRLYNSASATPESGTIIAERLTAEQLASGYAAFMLQAQRDDRDYWGQELGADALPVLGSSHRVYLNGHLTCGGEVKEGTYSNAVSAPLVDDHTWTADHVCSTCGVAEEPALSDDVYQIANAGNLLWFQREVTLKGNNKINAALTTDLDLSGITDAEHSWAPIGSNNEFQGTFDGQGHSITGLTINDNKANYAALFGNTHYATIRDLNVTASITAKNYAAILVGYASESKITNCTTRGTVSGYQYVGGLVGQVYNSDFTDCTNYADVTASYNNVGGLIAYAQYGKMNHCFNYGDVTCTEVTYENNVGGLAGRVYDGIKLDRCANYGDVTGAGPSVGGLMGYNSGASSNNHVYYCANYGNVSGKYATGGLCGQHFGQDWNHCFNAGDVVAKEEVNNGRTFGYISSVDNFDNIYYDATRTYTNVRDDEGSKRVGFTREQLASGEAAYTLGTPFGQQLGTDLLPRLDAPQVYYGRYQHAVAEPVFEEPQYSNLILGDATSEHAFDDGVCTICGKHDDYIWETIHSGVYADWTSTNKDEDNSQSSHVYTITGAEVGDHISFDWTVSSEQNYDWFIAEITLPDGTKQELVRASGISQSGSEDYEITAPGIYLLTVKYTKDGSGAAGEDQASVTNVCGPKLAATDKIYGDVDGDNTFDLNDVNAIRDMLLDPTTENLKADFNGDGRVTIGDTTEAIHQLLMP